MTGALPPSRCFPQGSEEGGKSHGKLLGSDAGGQAGRRAGSNIKGDSFLAVNGLIKNLGSCLFYPGKAADAAATLWFLPGQFSKGHQSSKGDWAPGEAAGGEVWRAASPQQLPWPYAGGILLLFAPFLTTWNLSKAAVYCVREVIQGLKKTLQALLSTVLIRKRKTFLQASSGIRYVPVMWVQLGP